MEKSKPQPEKDAVDLDAKLENMETRILSFYNDHDQKCNERLKQSHANFNVKIANIADTANTAVQTARETVAKFVSNRVMR